MSMITYHLTISSGPILPLKAVPGDSDISVTMKSRDTNERYTVLVKSSGSLRQIFGHHIHQRFSRHFVFV